MARDSKSASDSLGPVASAVQRQMSAFYLTEPEGLAPLGTPNDYGLKGYSEVMIPYGAPADHTHLYFWQRLTDPSKPTYVMFHGVNGHWGGAVQYDGDKVQRDGNGQAVVSQHRIEWLKTLPEDANVIAVSMPGFGKSSGEPCRPNFDEANEALYRYVRREQIRPENVIAQGESMGANHALNFAATVYEKYGKAVHQVTAVVPFTQSGEAAKDYLDAMPPSAANALISATTSMTFSDRHNHDNMHEIERLKGSGTRILVVSANDEKLVSPHGHQHKLAMKARDVGLCTVMQEQVFARHGDWDPQLVQRAAQRLSADPDAKPGSFTQLVEETRTSGPRTV